MSTSRFLFKSIPRSRTQMHLKLKSLVRTKNTINITIATIDKSRHYLYNQFDILFAMKYSTVIICYKLFIQ